MRTLDVCERCKGAILAPKAQAWGALIGVGLLLLGETRSTRMVGTGLLGVVAAGGTCKCGLVPKDEEAAK